MVHKTTKKQLKKIRDITNCGYLSKNTFFIECREDNGKIKQVIFEVKNVNTRNEIVSKLKHLIVNTL